METNKIDYITIQQYLDGSLDKEAMHQLEKQALDDPFLADALEGYTNINKPATRQLSLLQTQLEERIAQQQENKNVFSFSWQRLSVAAAAGLLFITASILFWMKDQKGEEQLASNPKQVEVVLTPKDSLLSDRSLTEQEFASSTKLVQKKIPQETNEVGKVAALKQKIFPDQMGKTEASDAAIVYNEVAVIDDVTQKKQGISVAPSQKTESPQIRIRGMSTLSAKNIVGKVVSNSGEPLPGVSVSLQNAGKSTVTNSNGFFYLNDSIGGNLTISYVGFDSKEVKAKPGNYLTIALNEDNKSLSEVVVVGYGTAKELKEYPEPVIGWHKYKDYLQNSISNNKDLPSGRVVIAFKVNADGRLSDFKIKKGLDDARNQEAIRLIKEGPAWNSGKQLEASVTVRFK